MDKLKLRVQNADWWEIGYLVIYGAIFCYDFLNSTMFQVQWPPRFGYIFFVASALYTIAKFIWHNTYTKKEMIFSCIILVAFIVPAVLTDYSFLFWIGFLIVGAKDVDFDKILKVYLTLGIIITLAAFVASQMGWIENLVYVVIRDDVWTVRNSYGSVYPTDFAAHLFYLAIAGVCLCENRITWGKIINFVVLALFVLDKCDARTSFICMLTMAVLLIFVHLFKDKIKKNWFYYILNTANIGFAIIYISLTHLYTEANERLYQINDLLSDRLKITKEAIELYDYKLFGQTIQELGYGRTLEKAIDYFYIDDSYIRIALLYGVVLFVVVLVMFWFDGVKAIKSGRIIVLVSIAAIALHSFMEHHLIEVAFNPMLCLLFSNLKEKKQEKDYA